MRRHGFLTVTAATLLALLAWGTPPRAQAAGPGTVTGRLMNGTLRRPLPDAEVVLLQMGAGKTNVVARTGTDRAGRFRFSDLDHAGEQTLLVTATYKDVPYFSTPLRLSPRGRAASVEVSVFEPTTDPAVVAVAFRIVMIRQVLPGRLVVRDVVGLQSREPRAFVGKGSAAARISLPPGASNVQIIRGVAPLTVDALGVIDTLPVTPSVREAVLQYEVGYGRPRTAVRWPVEYPTASFDLILPEWIEVREANLAPQVPRQVQGQRLRRFAAERLPPGRDVAVALAGLPLNVRPLLVAMTGISLTAGLLVALARPLMKKRRLRPEVVRERLIEALADLDDDFDGGAIPFAVYRRRREDLMAQLPLDPGAASAEPEGDDAGEVPRRISPATVSPSSARERDSGGPG